MHGATIKIDGAQQAKLSNNHKNTRLKLVKERFKFFNVNFKLLKSIYVHLLVCYLNAV